MKYIFIILLLSICLFSCDIAIIPDFWSINTNEDFSNYSIDEIIAWVDNNIKYSRDYTSRGKVEFWKTPQEALDDENGDCEEMAILTLALIYKYKNIKGSLKINRNKNDKGRHAFIIVNKKQYLNKKGFNTNIEYHLFDDIPFIASARR